MVINVIMIFAVTTVSVLGLTMIHTCNGVEPEVVEEDGREVGIWFHNNIKRVQPIMDDLPERPE